MAGKDAARFKENPASKTVKPSGDVDVQKMAPQQRARYLAYEKPSKAVEDSLLSTRNRLKEGAMALRAAPKAHPNAEQTRQAKVVGQLKAAEARNRVRVMRLRFQCMRAQEINHLISSQPTARDAVRLEVFLPPRQDTRYPPDPLEKFERQRVEAILMDECGLTIKRST